MLKNCINHTMTLGKVEIMLLGLINNLGYTRAQILHGFRLVTSRTKQTRFVITKQTINLIGVTNLSKWKLKCFNDLNPRITTKSFVNRGGNCGNDLSQNYK